MTDAPKETPEGQVANIAAKAVGASLRIEKIGNLGKIGGNLGSLGKVGPKTNFGKLGAGAGLLSEHAKLVQALQPSIDRQRALQDEIQRSSARRIIEVPTPDTSERDATIATARAVEALLANAVETTQTMAALLDNAEASGGTNAKMLWWARAAAALSAVGILVAVLLR